MNLDRLKVQMMMRYPFFGSQLHNCKLKESKEIPTACATLRGELLFNPDFMDSLSEEEQLFVVGHEMLHVVLLHCHRIFEWHDTSLRPIGNIAADYLVNWTGKEMGMTPPKIITLLDSKYTPEQWTLEGLTKELLKNAKCIDISDPGGDIGKGNDIKDDGKGQEPLSDEEKRDFERELKSSFQAAIMQAKKRGDLPASLARLADEILKPKVNWRAELQDWFNIRVKDQRSWHKPNRKKIYASQYWPIKESLGCGHIGIAVDCSGSINQDTLNVWGSELNHIFEICKPTKVTICYFDTKKIVKEYEELPIKLEVCLGGGTDFSVPIDHFNSEVEDPITGLVFMTDMFGDWPKEPLDYPMVILSITENHVAPYGKTIYCDMAQ